MTSGGVIRDFTRPDPAVVAALGSFGVATIHEVNGRRGLMDAGLRPLIEGARASGTAVTCLSPPGDNLMVHVALSLCREGDVLVITTTGPSAHGVVGELMATQARYRGVRALVVDAGIRDVADLRRMGLPAWSRYRHALGTEKRLPGWVNFPVSCAGVLVHPGDVVVADDDGVVIVPQPEAAPVAAAAAARAAREDALRDRYASGASSMDVYSIAQLLTELGVPILDHPSEITSDLHPVVLSPERE